MKTRTIINASLLTLMIFVLAACLPTNNTEENTNEESSSVNNGVEIETTTISSSSEEESEEGEEAEEETESVDYQSAEPQYLAFNQADYEADLGKRPVALFFHAGWCPVCQGMEKDINENLSSLPKGTKIYKVDYDNSDELKQEYGITMQSTVVVINANGEAVETLSGPTSEEIGTAVEGTL